MVWDGFVERERWRQQVGENAARMAFAWGVATTTGQGHVVLNRVIDFGLAFAEKPMIAYGWEILNRSDFTADTAGGATLPVPFCSGGVYQWKVDGRGLYVGAHVAVAIYCDDTIQIEHHWTFTGTAIKDLGSGAKLGG